jgi:protein-S-isoprenylcysteine O-methyltransferase Ste14/uncharacterized protein YndB with AHSA1/START domain
VAAGLVPWLVTGWEAQDWWLPVRILGGLMIGAGLAVLLQAFARFVVEGIGTPAPVAPPERLVVGGAYRYVRNPMYLAVAALIVGQGLLLGQAILLLYAAGFCVAVAAFVHGYEEPTLARRFGAQYEAYRRAVPAWRPRRTPWEPAGASHSRSRHAQGGRRMPEAKPFRVEVVIRTPHIEVWRALTEPDQVRRWFGWDYAGLDEEIELMFVTGAKHEPPGRILMFEGEDQSAIEVEADGAHTIVRAVNPASLEDVVPGDAYDPIEEGWRAFLLQLRDYLERHPGKRRRTIRLTSEAKPIAVLAAVAGQVEGESRRASPHLSVTTTDSYGRGLVVVDSSEPLDSADTGRVNVTITTYGLDDERFAALRQRWQATLNELAKDVEVTA